MKKILVLGSMNNLMTCYSNDLSQLGADVIQVVGFPKKLHLHDPKKFLSENQLSKFKVIRIPFMHNFILPAISFLYYAVLKLFLPKNWKPDVVLFNDTYLTLANYFLKAEKIFIPHGGDIETWCGFNGSTANSLALNMKNSGIFQLMPFFLRKLYIDFIIKSFDKNLKCVDGVIYFPRSFTKVTNYISKYCKANNIFYWERYDISLAPLSNRQLNLTQRKTINDRRFKILVPVRFAYKTFPEGNFEFNKGSDIIIRGIERFLEINNDDIEIVFYEKGVDVDHAKKLVESSPALKNSVTWRSAVPFNKFLDELEDADFCFDSVGEHWPGAIAAYALVLGINIGANFKKVRHLLPNEDLPHLYNINTEEEVCSALLDCLANRERQAVSDDTLLKIKNAYSTINIAEEILNIR